MNNQEGLDIEELCGLVLTDAALSVCKPAGPVATGCCLNCGQPVESPRRWCDADCRDQWERGEQ